MKRRDFLKSISAAATASALPAPAVWSPAKAQSRQETLLVVTEYSPNNFDIHGVGTNRPGYEVSELLTGDDARQEDAADGVEILRSRQVRP
jgi:peptide/nickel transport system substrate-binding protein